MGTHTNVKWPEGKDETPLLVKQLIIRQGIGVTTRPLAVAETCLFTLGLDKKASEIKLKEKLFTLGIETKSNFDALEKVLEWFAEYNPEEEKPAASDQKPTRKFKPQKLPGDPLFG